MAFAVSARATEAGIRAARFDRASRIVSQTLKDEVSRRASQARLWFAEAVAELNCFLGTSDRSIQGRLTPMQVIARVASERHWSVASILSARRTVALVHARHEAVHEVVRLFPHLTYPQIGRIFKRDHSTIIYAKNKWPRIAAKLGIPVEPIEGRTPTKGDASHAQHS